MMFESGTFSPATQHELSATLDVTWQAMSRTRQNMRLLDDQRARLEKSIRELKEELERAQRGSKENADAIHALEKQLRESDEERRDLEAQLGKARERQTALEAELPDARAAMARLAEEKERLQRELAEACDEIAQKDAQLAADEGLANTLQIDVDFLRRTMEQLDARLEGQAAGPALTSSHRGKRAVWIGCTDCPGCELFTWYDMEKLSASGPDQALEILSGQGADALITDITVTGIDWLSEVRKRWPDLAIIVTTGSGDGHPETDATVRSIATTVIPGPCEHNDVAAALRSAFLRKALSSGIGAPDAAKMAKSGFLADMGHEIRTPIAAVLGFAEHLLADGDINRAPASRVKAINTIIRNCRHLLALINDLLDFSNKVETGAGDIERIASPGTAGNMAVCHKALCVNP